MLELRVHLLPALVDPADMAGRTVIVVDVLRATTTICHALAAGAECVVPCLEIDEARATAAKLGADARLGGERLGRRIEGFHFGNSPSEYTRESVAGRTVVFTTTNGTRAMRRAAQAGEVLMGAFVNLSAVVAAAAECERADVLCAGTGGVITAEDALFAGAVVDRLGLPAAGLNDQALLARDAWRTFAHSGRPLAAALRECQGGRNLIAEGFDADIDTAAEIDARNVLPRLDLPSGRITLR
ncbi:MAG: 2-phosphosulfolactate phosphatase [Planctomycetales bacterium]|nr:2-phosphosulfolactate phosphatase [Planctomycetales bacterium]MBN8624121.1 2-phosphosulfolactate phosphatase [Planctomycetota bacterium]